MTRTSALCLSVAACLALACDQPDQPPAGGGAGTGLVVVASDYKSTVVSLVDPATGSPSRDDCIDSGAATPVLSLALSGDVVLPTQPVPGHEVVLVDRSNGTLTFLDPTTCKPRAQTSVGAKLNPHDFLGLTPNKAYVTRYDEADGVGGDLAIVDPVSGKLKGRIDLASFADPSAGILARPDRLILADGKVYVVLGALSADYMKAGPGKLAVIDPVSDMVTGSVTLTGLSGCSTVDYVAARKTVLVACDGTMNPAGSGIAAVALGSEPTQVLVTPASATGSVPFSGLLVAGLGGGIALAATNGDFSGTPPDALWAVDTLAATATKIADAGGSFVLGTAAADPAGGRALVTDASKGAPRVLVVSGSAAGGWTIESSADPDPAKGLPPRAIAWY